MRKFLDRIYQLSGFLAALSILAICSIICLQVVFNLITRLRIFEANLTIPSYADFAGYLLAAASFLALPYALMRGGHIRVTLFLGVIGERMRFLADLLSLSLCLMVSAGATWYMASLNYDSYRFGDKSPGIIAIPIWIVQLPLTIGLALLSVAFADLIVKTLSEGRPLPESQGTE
jgi:TRAP-type mannitol/chloroaromatic compound transport system permease small subunit